MMPVSKYLLLVINDMSCKNETLRVGTVWLSDVFGDHVTSLIGRTP